MIRKLIPLFALLLAFDASAAVSIRAMRQAALTTTGSQDYTIGSFGTVQGALVLGTTGITDDTAANHGGMWVSMTDCTNVRNVSAGFTHGDFNGSSDRQSRDNGTIRFTDGSNQRAVGTLTCITDGINIDWTTAPSAAYLLTVILFGGADMDVAVGSFAHGNPTTVVNTLSWEPDVLIGMSGNQTFNETTGADAIISLGFAANGSGGTTQGAFGVTDNDPVDPTDESGIIDDDDWIALLPVSSGTPDNGAEITAWSSTGFTSTLTAGTGFTLGYMALNFNGVATAEVKPFSSPGSTAGNNVVSGLTVDPDYVFTLLGMHSAYDTGDTATLAGAMGVSFFNATESFSNSFSNEDNVTTTDASSRVDDRAINLSDHDGVLMYAATLTSLDATGWTLNYATEADSADRAWLALAIGPAASGGGTVVNPISGRGGAAARPIN